MNMRGAIDIRGHHIKVPANVNTADGWRAFCLALREQFQLEVNRGDRCTSAVVSLHFEDERCDHE